MNRHFGIIFLAAILLGGMLGVLVVVNHLARAEGLASQDATLTVNTLVDNMTVDGHCSLREAVSAANTNVAIDTCPAGTATTDTINFSVSGTIPLNLQLDIQAAGGPLSIEGEGVITLSGGDSNRIFNVNSGADLVLEGLNIDSGSEVEGGGIYNSGDLVLRNSNFSNNTALSKGGGIYNIGTMSVISTTLVGNDVFSYSGGGIYNLGHLTLRNGILESNGANHNGGGIYNGGVMTITNSTLSENDAGYYGGGIDNYGTVNLMNSTLAGNHALYGGSVSNGSVMTITNSTMSGNSAGYDGGAIYVSGESKLTIESSTLTNNSAEFGGGIYFGSGMGDTFRNTILANNTATVEGPDCYAMTLTSEGYNLIGDKLGCMFTPTTGDLIGIDAKLGTLQDNGGPTATHALSAGSLAINHGNPEGCKDSTDRLLIVDQRGFPRYGRCDIGAYESQPALSGQGVVALPIVIRSCAPPLFFDDFSDPSSGWPSGESTNVLIEYLNNEYRIWAKNPWVSAGVSPGSVVSDYIVVSDVRNVTGVDGAYGIMFDFALDEFHYYVFGIGPTSNYEIWRFAEGAWTPLASGFADSIHSGTASNQLKIEREGSQIWAYANGELLNIIDEATFTGPRHLGLIARSYAEPNVDVRFDNFTVYPISCGSSDALFSIDGRTPAMKVFEFGAENK